MIFKIYFIVRVFIIGASIVGIIYIFISGIIINYILYILWICECFI